MKFAEPIWLFAGLLACVALLWRYRRFDARQRHELKQFASENLIAQLTGSVSSARRQFKRTLVVAGLACIALALARPLVGFRWEEARRKGLDLLVAIDTSKSMLAQDVKPDRLTRAKMAVEDLLDKMDGDRVGLIAFAGNAFLQCPLTLDYDAFRQSLDAVDTRIISRGGTDIAAAIHEAEAALEGKGNKERILVLLTDGEDLEGSALDVARAAARHGLKIFTVGIGSANGELIPVIDDQGGTQFVKDASGQFVKSRLDESMLKQIAEATGAMYQPLGQQSQGLETIYQKGLAKFTRHNLTSRMNKVYLERYQWPLGLGLLCLMIEPLIGSRRRKTTPKPATATLPALPGVRASSISGGPRPSSLASPIRKGLHPPAQGCEQRATLGRQEQRGFKPERVTAPLLRRTAVVVLAVIGLANSAHASSQTGERAFQKGDYAKAEHDYRQAAAKSPDKPVLQFNHGAAAYKAGNFDAAAQSFAKAMKTGDLRLQEDDYYNLGNTQYRIGQKTQKANQQQTIKSWEQAVQSYEAALQLKTDDADAKYNRDLVKRKLEELKKQQQQQQQNQQQNQDKNQQSKKDQNKQDNQQSKDQSQQSDQKNQQDKQNNGSGQQDNKDQKNDQHQGKADQDQKPSSGQNEQNEKQNPQERKGGGSDQQSQNHQEKAQPDKSNPGSSDNQADKKPDVKDQQAQSGQKPDPAKQDNPPQARNPQPDPSAAQDRADAQREPGQMSREEARQLLDSLKSGDRKMPLEPYSRGNAGARNDEPIKDW